MHGAVGVTEKRFCRVTQKWQWVLKSRKKRHKFTKGKREKCVEKTQRYKRLRASVKQLDAGWEEEESNQALLIMPPQREVNK